MKDVTQSSQDWEDFWYNSPINSPYIVMTDEELYDELVDNVTHQTTEAK